jgi:competence protein ComEC
VSRRTVLYAVLALAIATGWRATSAPPHRSPPGGLRITFFDVGQGDAALVETRDGAVLIDQGPPEAEVSAQLRRLGVRRLSIVVLTHPQRDHIGGAAQVMKDVGVDRVLDPGLAISGPEERSALAAARARHLRVDMARPGVAYRIGRLRMRVLWPDGPGLPSEDPNLNATVLLVSYGETDALFTADAESAVLLATRPRPVEILKVAHHGSADPLLPTLLAATRPRVAVISVGEGNSYGHPTPETMAALTDFPGLAVYRTDDHGAITVESDGREIAVATEH